MRSPAPSSRTYSLPITSSAGDVTSEYFLVEYITQSGNNADLKWWTRDSGVRIWTMLAQQFSEEPLVMLIDDYYQCSFCPRPLSDVDTNWVVISYPFDEVTAKGMEKYAKKNFQHLNPPK